MLRHAERPTLAPPPCDPPAFPPTPAPSRLHGGGRPTAVDARVLSVLEAVARQLDNPQSVKHLAARLGRHWFWTARGQETSQEWCGARGSSMIVTGT